MTVTYTHKDAVLSEECNRKGEPIYRYQLSREWTEGHRGSLCWLMLNPSTANALDDDPTIRRCVGFACDLGFSGIIVANAFAFRTSHPFLLKGQHRSGVDVIGPDNDDWILEAADESEMIICGWGIHGGLFGRDEQVRKLLSGRDLYALGFTKGGQPGHPLYIPKDTKPGLWK